MKIISWNVNGIRAAIRKGLPDFLKRENADIYCFQEIKIGSKDLNVLFPIVSMDGYDAHWYPSEKGGYSGTGILTRIQPLSVIRGIGDPVYDSEGRVLTVEFLKFYLIVVYSPNSQHGLTRLDFRLDFEKKFLAYCKKLDKKKPLVITGDLNVAHTEIDLANPKQNVKNAGFTPEERAAFTKLLFAGYVDTFRMFEKGGGHYTWWSHFSNARARNIGWRIDYFLASDRLKARVRESKILPAVQGSDHAPVSLVIDA